MCKCPWDVGRVVENARTACRGADSRDVGLYVDVFSATERSGGAAHVAATVRDRNALAKDAAMARDGDIVVVKGDELLFGGMGWV